MSLQGDRRKAVFYPAIRGGISENTKWNVYLVGCGGTGSFIAHAVAQLKGCNLNVAEKIGRIVLIDPDTVEMANIGRQNFAPADIGFNKAQVLACRYNKAFGLQMEWIDARYNKKMVSDRNQTLSRNILVGAVDTGKARRTIAKSVKSKEFTDKVIWLDSGNGYQKGQVVIGNTFDEKKLKESIDPSVNISSWLPYPSMVLPELLEDDPDQMPSCAEAVEREEQGLFVNRFMADIVGDYIQQLVKGELKVSQSWVELRTKEMISVPITQYDIDRHCDQEEKESRLVLANSMELVDQAI